MRAEINEEENRKNIENLLNQKLLLRNLNKIDKILADLPREDSYY